MYHFLQVKFHNTNDLSVCQILKWISLSAVSSDHLHFLCLYNETTLVKRWETSAWVPQTLFHILTRRLVDFYIPAWELNCLPLHFPIDKFPKALYYHGDDCTFRGVKLMAYNWLIKCLLISKFLGDEDAGNGYFYTWKSAYFIPVSIPGVPEAMDNRFCV